LLGSHAADTGVVASAAAIIAVPYTAFFIAILPVRLKPVQAGPDYWLRLVGYGLGPHSAVIWRLRKAL
jgi:hypothetical protein